MNTDAAAKKTSEAKPEAQARSDGPEVLPTNRGGSAEAPEDTVPGGNYARQEPTAQKENPLSQTGAACGSAAVPSRVVPEDVHEAIVANLEAGVSDYVRSQEEQHQQRLNAQLKTCLLYTSPSPRDATLSRMPSSA